MPYMPIHKTQIQFSLVGRGFHCVLARISLQNGTMLGESVQVTNVNVGKGLAPSGGKMLHIHTIFRRIRKMLRVRIEIFRCCKYLLPEGASPFPTVRFDRLYVLSLPLRSFRCVSQHAMEAAPYEKNKPFPICSTRHKKRKLLGL